MRTPFENFSFRFASSREHLEVGAREHRLRHVNRDRIADGRNDDTRRIELPKRLDVTGHAGVRGQAGARLCQGSAEVHLQCPGRRDGHATRDDVDLAC